MVLHKLVLKKRLLPDEEKSDDKVSFSIVFGYDEENMTLTDDYEKIDVTRLDKWHDFRNTFDDDLLVEGFTACLYSPQDDNELIERLDGISAKGGAVGDKHKYDYFVVFYNLADAIVGKIAKDADKKSDKQLVDEYYNSVCSIIKDSIGDAVSGVVEYSVYLSLGSADIAVVFCLPHSDGRANDKWVEDISTKLSADGFFDRSKLTVKKKSSNNKLGDDDDGDGSIAYSDKPCVDKTDELEVAIKKFNSAYGRLADGQHKAHKRVQCALRDILNVYKQIAYSPYSHDIVNTIGKFLLSFLSAVTKFIENINNKYVSPYTYTKMRKNDSSIVRVDEYSSYIEHIICAERDALSPLWFSEHVFYDDRRIIRHSVGGFIKLLYAYNELFQRWNEVYAEENQTDPILLFATSGGVDIIETLDLFNYNHGVLDGALRPIVVTMPEASLWDIEGSIWRVAHEFFHVRGNKCRGSRAEKYFDGLCNIFAEHCYNCIVEEAKRKKANIIFDSRVKNSSLGEIYTDPRDLFAAISDYVNYCLIPKNLCGDATKNFEDICSEMKSFSDALNKGLIEDRQRYIDKIVNYIKEICKREPEYISEYKQIEDRDPVNMVRLRDSARRALVKSLEIMRARKDDEKARTIRQEADKELAKAILREINSADEQIFGPYSLYDMVFSDKTVGSHFSAIYDYAVESYFDNIEGSATKARRNIESTLPGLYKECVADCLAVRASGLNEKDDGFVGYILCMLYEKRSLVEFFTVNGEGFDLFKILRSGVVKDVCRLGYNKTSAEKYIADFYEKIMFPHANDEKRKSDYVKDLTEYIESLLKYYGRYKNKGYIIGLCDYLTECLRENTTECERIRSSIGFDINDVRNDMEESYANFAFAHWLRLYGDKYNEGQ